MTCIICNRTVQLIVEKDGVRYWGCSTCGTQVVEAGGDVPNHVTVPALVKRVQSACDSVKVDNPGLGRIRSAIVNLPLWWDIADYAGRKMEVTPS